MLDTLRHVTTPELVELRLHPAGILPRGFAYILDLFIQGCIIILSAIVFSIIGKMGVGVWLLTLFIVFWFYPVLFEVLAHGATPGKRALGLVVLNDDGTPISWGASFSRNLLRFGDFLPMLYASGLLSMLLHHEFRRFGDIVAGTLVCYRQSRIRLPNIPKAPPIAPSQVLPRKAQQAVVMFAERVPNLTPSRQEELADLIPELSSPSALAGQSPLRGAARLVGIANYLIGR